MKICQGTGSGSSDVYVSKWKFFDECSFLDEVISSNRPTCSNIIRESNQSTTADCNLAVSEDKIDSKRESSITLTSDGGENHPKRRKRSTDSPFLESAATALNRIAKGVSSDDEDEWTTFGKDVANSLRGLPDKDLQRKVKFAVQSAIFQASEPPRPAYPSYNYSNESFQGLKPWT